MNWLNRLLFKQHRPIKLMPMPIPQRRPFFWYKIEGSVPHATVYLVIDRGGNTRNRYVTWNN